MTATRTGKSAVLIAVIATVGAWAIWGIIVSRLNPNEIGLGGFVIFYAVLFLAVSGSATVLGLLARRRSSDPEHALRVAVRQGMITGVGAVAAVILQSRGLLSWINLVFLVAALTILELFVISLQRREGRQSEVT
ncbi:MAG: hypothetical protein ABIG71_04035 [Candidatus Uhrbacteria bacterium]